MSDTENQAAAFRADTEKFKKKIQLAMQESRVDTWAADRMIYVVDYLDTLLQGFFAFQNVLWDRFGENGEFLGRHVGEILDAHLKLVQQNADKVATAAQKKLDAWVETQKSLPDELRKAVDELPGVWAQTRIRDALEQALPDALKEFHVRIQNNPALLDDMVPVWNAQLVNALQNWIPSVAKSGLQQLQNDTGLQADLENIVQAQAQDALSKIDFSAPWQRALKDTLDVGSAFGQQQTKTLRAAIAPLMQEHLQKAIEDLSASTLEQHLQARLQQVLEDAVAAALPDLLAQSLEPALGNVIRAHFLKNPLDRALVDSIEKMNRKLMRAEERLEAMQQAEAERTTQMQAQLGTLTEVVQQLQMEAATSEQRVLTVIRQILEGETANA